MTNFYFVGVDLGLDGGVALVNGMGGLERLEKMPILTSTVKRPNTKSGKGTVREYDIAGCRRLISQMQNHGTPSLAEARPVTTLTMEGGFYGPTAQTVRSLYRGEAIWETLADMFGVPVLSVTPSTIGAYFGIKNDPEKTKAENKASHRLLAAKLFPDWADRFKPVGSDGLADAALLAEYGRRKA